MRALPVLRARLDALKAQPQGRAAHAGACGQPGHEEVEAARDESESEKQEDGDQSDVHGNPLEDECFTAVSRGAARPFYPAPASSPLRRAGSSGQAIGPWGPGTTVTGVSKMSVRTSSRMISSGVPMKATLPSLSAQIREA